MNKAQLVFKKYMRDEKKNPFGVAVVVKRDDGSIHYGYSLTHPKDQFDKKRGTEIAIGRAFSAKLPEDHSLLPIVPERRETVANYYEGLAKKLERYLVNHG